MGTGEFSFFSPPAKWALHMLVFSLTFSVFFYIQTSHCCLRSLSWGVSPTGAVTFVSELYAGFVSDQALTGVF